jgi:hypothetical protein
LNTAKRGLATLMSEEKKMAKTIEKGDGWLSREMGD